MSHTPGLWELDPSGNYIIARDEDGSIFVVAETFENLLVGDETANIALITAAPDLLAACKAFVEAWEKSSQLEKTDVALQMAKSAIARAESRE